MSEAGGGDAARARTRSTRVPGNRRLALAAAMLTALAALLAVLTLGGGDDEQRRSAQPADAAMKLIPASALVALHLSTDTGRPAVRRASTLAGRLPSWPQLREDLLSRVGGRGCGIDLREDAGREVAFALLPRRDGGSSPLLLTDAPARGLPDQGGQPCGSLVVRRIGKLVAIGEPDALAAAAAVNGGSARALASSAAYRRAAVRLPPERVITAWASGAGTRRLLLPIGGLLGTLARLVDMPGLQGAVASLVAEGDEARITIRRASSRGVEAPAFRPTLQDHAPADAISFSAAGDLAGGLQSLLLLNREGAVGTLDGLLKAGDGALTRLSRLVAESAFVVAPGPDGPVITLLALTRDAAKARAALSQLEPSLGRLIAAPEGAKFADTQLDGPARQLDVGGATLAYGFDGKVLVLSTSAAGVRAARADEPRLSSLKAFRAVAQELPSRVTSLVFLDPNQLLRLGVDTGTGLDDALQDVRDDLARVRSIGIHASGKGGSSTVELSLSIP